MNREIRPLIPCKASEEQLEKIARALLEGAEESQEQRKLTPAKIENPQDYILLEGKSYGSGNDKYSYPDLLVCKYRLTCSDNVKEIGKELELELKNTAKELNGRKYMGNVKWEQALKINLMLGGFTLPIMEFRDFLALLKSGKAFDGNGKKVDSKELEMILDEIITVREPWRAEHLDADFKYENDNFYLCTNHRLVNGVLEPQYKKPLQACLMEDRKPGIDFNEWLKNATNQGMPKQNINKGDLWFWAQMKDNNSVASFYALSDRVYLYCYWNRSYAGGGLGVRFARKKFK